MTSTTDHTPYEVFQRAIAAGVQPTIHDCWSDFAHWEIARRFADDPSHPAKAAIEWIDSMEALRLGLSEFSGESQVDCQAALDDAYEAFAKLHHSAELVRAIGLWIAYRKDEQQ